MNRAVIVVLVWAFATSCAVVRMGDGIPSSARERERLATASSAADSSYLREMNAVMQIVAPRFWRDSLSRVVDVTQFRTSVEEYFALRDIETRPDTPYRNEWREEMDRRVAYCRANLMSTVDAPIRDIRWELVLQIGIPSFNRRIPDTAVFETFVLYWDELGIEIACRTLKLGGPPAQTFAWSEPYGDAGRDPLVGCIGGTCLGPKLPPTEEQVTGLVDHRKTVADALANDSRFAPFPGLKKSISTNLAPLIFPNDDGTSDLWVATLTRGDQFSDSTIRSDRFDVGLTVYDQSQQIAGRDSTSIAGLRHLGDVTDIEELAVPAYVGCPRLEPGFYEYVVSLRGVNESNLGVYRDTITIPTRRALRGASDVMIAFAPGVASGNGIARHGLQLHANPSGSYARSDSLSVYVEFPENLIPGEEYRVTVSLIPQKNQLASWQPIKVRERTLLSAVFPRSALDGKFIGSISLEEAKRGRYFLSVQIASQLEDPPGEEPVMAWTEIEVK